MVVDPQCFICGDGPDYVIRISTEFAFEMSIPICEFHNNEKDVASLVSMTRVVGSPTALTSTFGGKSMAGPYYKSLLGESGSVRQVTVFRITRDKNPGLLVSLLKWLFGGKK